MKFHALFSSLKCIVSMSNGILFLVRAKKHKSCCIIIQVALAFNMSNN